MAPPRQPTTTGEAPIIRAAGAVPLSGFYILYFGSIGITLPFLPQWFRSLGLSGSEIGVLLALQPTMALVVPPLWGWAVDRFGRPDLVLGAISLGMLLGFSPLAFASRFETLFLSMTAYAFFASSMTTVLDSIALQRVALHGGAYARIRLFGSVGFVISSALFGLLIPVIDRRVVFAALGCMAGFLLWSFTVRARAAGAPKRHPLAGIRLLKHRDLALMLAACSLHWIACAPFHGIFAIHVTALGLDPWVVGMSAGLGVLAEIAVMFAYPRISHLFAPRYVLFAAFVISAFRWLGMALTRDPEVIVALSLLHGFTFGAFFVAAVNFLVRRVPDSMRGSGQALLASTTFGVGGLVGYLTAGTGYELLGGHALFAVAAGAQLLPALLVLAVRDPVVTRVELSPPSPSHQ